MREFGSILKKLSNSRHIITLLVNRLMLVSALEEKCSGVDVDWTRLEFQYFGKSDGVGYVAAGEL